MGTLGFTNENITSGSNYSYWTDSTESLIYGRVDSDIVTDVLIVGGGIAGLTTAYCLSKAGRKVVVVEDGYLGSGESGRTTAQITYALDDRYYELESFLGKEKTTMAAQSHKHALEWIVDVVEREGIECDFRRVDGYLFLDPTDKKENLRKEFAATQLASLPTHILSEIPGFTANNQQECLKFPNQGQFHIMRYLKGLANAITRYGGKIFTQSKAVDITKEGATVNGYIVVANHIVVATNTPINNLVTMHTKQWPYRTYVIGAKIPKGTLPYAMWWDTGDQKSTWITKPYHYVRLQPYDQEFDLLLCGGEDHKTGQADHEDIPEELRYNSLVYWTKKYFPYFDDVSYRWSGQVMEPVDSLGFIGKNPGDDNIYIITGDSGNGMTHGTLGGLLIHDLIVGIKNPWLELYDPARITLRTADDYLKEVGNMTVEMLKGKFSSSEVTEVSRIGLCEGAVVSCNLKKVAAYRDKNGTLHTFSATCPHMGGTLVWNADEHSFDCPLHGSRFTSYGKTINGPAVTDLKETPL